MAHPVKTRSDRERARERYADGGRMRSESTEYAKGRRDLRRTPPVTIMEDLIGGLSPSKAQDNSVRDAIRRGAGQKLRETGGYDWKPYKRGGKAK